MLGPSQLSFLPSYSLSNLSLQLWKRAHSTNKGLEKLLPLRQCSFGLRLAVCRKSNNLEYQWPLCVSQEAQVAVDLQISAPHCFPFLGSHSGSVLVFPDQQVYKGHLWAVYVHPFRLLWLAKPSMIISLILCTCQ